MYLNSQVTVTGHVSATTTQPGNTLWIGNQPTGDVPGGYVFHGVLDDIRIYNRALSADEVALLYACESAPILSEFHALLFGDLDGGVKLAESRRLETRGRPAGKSLFVRRSRTDLIFHPETAAFDDDVVDVVQ